MLKIYEYITWRISCDKMLKFPYRNKQWNEIVEIKDVNSPRAKDEKEC